MLLENGLLPFAVDLLRYLNSTDESDLDIGLTSASLICRLVGNQESGPGPEAIRSNIKVNFL